MDLSGLGMRVYENLRAQRLVASEPNGSTVYEFGAKVSGLAAQEGSQDCSASGGALRKVAAQGVRCSLRMNRGTGGWRALRIYEFLRAGVVVSRLMKVDSDQLVRVSDIAERCGVTKAAVSNWVARWDDFPAPVVQLPKGKVWVWWQVEAWARQHGKVYAGGLLEEVQETRGSELEDVSEIRRLFDPQTGERYLNQDDVVEWLLHQGLLTENRPITKSPAQRLRELANALAHA